MVTSAHEQHQMYRRMDTNAHEQHQMNNGNGMECVKYNDDEISQRTRHLNNPQIN